MTRSTINSRSIEGIHSIDATGTVTAAGLTVDTDTLHIDSTNNRVGIGRTSLNYKFEVSSASDVAVGLYNSSSVTSGNRATLASLNSDASSVGYIRFGAVTDNVGTDIQFGVRPAGGSLTEAMRINSSGNVGIGTSSPTGFSGYTSVDINNATSGAIIDLSQGDSMKGRLIATASTMAIETASSVPIIFQPAGTERMRIDSSGKVAIGSTTSLEQLRVAGNIELYNDDVDGYIWFHDTGTRSWSVGSDQSTGNFAITNVNGLASGHQLLINSSGNVGIGVTSMTNKLVLPNAAYFAMQDTGGAESLAIRANTSNAMEFLTGGGERMRIDSSGNVGIGTTGISPYKLRVSGAATGGVVYQRLENTGTTGSNNTTQYQIATNSNSLNISVNEQYNYSQISQAGNAINHYVDANNHFFRNNSATELMKIDSSGRVTTPYQPSWNTRSYGHNNASTGFTRVGSNDNGGTVSFTTQVGNGVNNGRFTAPVTGTYWVHVNGSDSSAGNAGLQIWKNGGNHLSSTAYLYSVNYNGTGVSAAIYLNANDYVEGKFVHFNSVNSALYDGSFSGFLIG
jgi:hypothetical protein